jgi:hypothetical protein
MDKKKRYHEAMMQGLNWWGIPTLFRCPHNSDSEGCDIALVGVPHSTGNGTTERDQHFGPRAVRNISALGRRAHLKYKLKIWEIITWSMGKKFGLLTPTMLIGFFVWFALTP